MRKSVVDYATIYNGPRESPRWFRPAIRLVIAVVVLLWIVVLTRLVTYFIAALYA